MKVLRGIVIVAGLFILSCAASDFKAGHYNKNRKEVGCGLHYTCRLGNGDIIVTTDPSVVEAPSAKKAAVFIEKTSYSPMDITDFDQGEEKSGKEELKFLEKVLVEKLAAETKDWKMNTARTLKVEAKEQVSLPVEERTIQIARIKTHPKTTRYDKEIFTRMTGGELAMDEPVLLHYGIKGKVVSIEENEVLVTFTPASDQPLDGPFGPVTVQDKGDHYVIEIDAQKGHLVRVGPAVGRISEVNTNTFRIDYSHPFGGETLMCDVKVTAIHRDPSVQVAVGSQVGEARLPPMGAQAVASTPSGLASGSNDQAKALLLPGNAPDIAQEGDLVEVDYTASLESGEVIWTTRNSVVEDPKRKKMDGHQAQEIFRSETILVGGKESFPGLADAVIGMQAGERKQFTLPAEKAFGERNPQLIRQFDCTKIIPKRVTLPAQEYVRQFGGFPVKDKTVAYNPYTIGRVVDITEQGAVLELSPNKEDMVSDFGSTRMRVIGDSIHITLTPKLGAPFELEKQRGNVVAVDDRRFTVDFNHPLAGENIVMDMKVVSLTKAASFAGKEIQWIEDYDKGLTAAEKLNKPAVLVLYTDWCSYCKKLFKTTLVDPRIKMMKDDFVWVKVNSGKQKELKALYGQKGFPMTVLLDTHGEVIGSIKGFRPANEFMVELKKALNGSSACPKLKAKNQMKKES
ncbi:MAG: thioredoxin family protein [Thermodesulfobacteriota bacterium]|nr:thioredoxin family protein [Thermodesulfobacteriota bacterium]